MDILVVSPLTVGYRWEIEMLASNVKALGFADGFHWLSYTDANVSKEDIAASSLIADKYQLNLWIREDSRTSSSYATSIRPWLIARWLEDNPEQKHGTYFYCDSDILFTRKPEFPAVDATHWKGSPTSQYSSVYPAFYEMRRYDLVNKMAACCGVSVREVNRNVRNCPGAQWLIDNPQPELFYEIYSASEKVYDIVKESKFSNPWLADMWVTPWLIRRFGIAADEDPLMTFSSMEDDYAEFHKFAIFHNSLPTPSGEHSHDSFRKYDWRNISPFGYDLKVGSDYAVRGYLEYMVSAFPPTTLSIIEKDGKPREIEA